jgi:hypothetical protein
MVDLFFIFAPIIFIIGMESVHLLWKKIYQPYRRIALIFGVVSIVGICIAGMVFLKNSNAYSPYHDIPAPIILPSGSSS